jgi:succinate dehydrogenase flavin-adding protein (antitoxin of CptAB toxin-antitoxin module)
VHPSTPPPAPQKLASKLLYRSKQRGFLELDLLVGLWAEEKLPMMTIAALTEFGAVLDEVRAGVPAGVQRGACRGLR